MSNNRALVEALGLSCPLGGDPYVCEGSFYEFVGCCTYNPCEDYSGACHKKTARPANSTFAYREETAQFKNKWFFICRSDNYTDRPGSTWSNMQYGAPRGTNASCLGSMPYDLDAYYYSDGGGFYTDAISLTPYKELREELFSYVQAKSDNTTEESEHTAVPAPQSNHASEIDTGVTQSTLSRADIIGLSVGIFVFAVVLLALLGRYFWISEMNKHLFSNHRAMDHESLAKAKTKANLKPRSCVEVASETAEENSLMDSSQKECPPWHGGQQRLNQKDFSWYMELVWDVLLTIAPTFFIVIPVLALCLDNQPFSSLGETILSIDRLVPTIYPILIAAVAARFYKNLSRWNLEQPNGVRLAVLEQIMGSQSFAGAVERLLFVRAHVSVGFVIFVIWAMSPLGGQAGARMVYHSHREISSSGNLYYADPAYQVSSFSSMEFQYVSELSVKSLYSSSLLQPPDQKSAPRDLWEMPKIPQRDKSKAIGEMYEIDQGALDRGENEYYSLLGTKIQGLDFIKQSDAQLKFSVQTSFLEFGCTNRYETFDSGTYRGLPQYDPLWGTIDLWKGVLNGTSFWLKWSQGVFWEEYNRNWDYIESFGNPHLVYMSSRLTPKNYMIMFNCSMDTVVLETEMECGLNSKNPGCAAVRQRLVDVPESKFTLMKQTMKSARAMYVLVRRFVTADGGFFNRIASATDAYIAGDVNPYARQGVIDWTTYDEGVVSKRLTSAFNTFHMATLNPLNHTDISFGKDPGPQIYSPVSPAVPTYYNSTEGSVVTRVEVYRTDKVWTAIHLTTTFILLILASLGLAFRLLIRGPDVVGFASSMTHDNPYTPLLDCGSAMPGPQRARWLRDMRVQLADVRPDNDVGYVAFRNLPSYLESKAEIDDNEQ
ncbi:unnamed protein product [Clonostachys byssicola]|uniref:Uncharacterized protein n=1 Tax=Clonostachys byssicola TaxID=160290 RepID=A0A9N9U4G1_9HYPO|nr:unnamed protein product [Clonostachys byssicola]